MSGMFCPYCGEKAHHPVEKSADFLEQGVMLLQMMASITDNLDKMLDMDRGSGGVEALMDKLLANPITKKLDNFRKMAESMKRKLDVHSRNKDMMGNIR